MRWRSKKVIKVGIALMLCLFVIIQFFQVDKTNPPVDERIGFQSIMSPPENIQEVLKASCYDCHSYESKYPWYTNIAPFSWIIKNHIIEGREYLNFSTWGNYTLIERQELLEESAEEIEEGKMPIFGYEPMHPKAKMTSANRIELIKWLRNGAHEH